MTLPLAPLSLPAITTTVSPFLTFTWSPPPAESRSPLRRCRAPFHAPSWSEHLRCQRDDLHELLVPQLPAHRAEDAGTTRLGVVLDEHRGVLVEPDVRTVRTTALLAGTDDDGLDDVTLFHAGTRDGVLHGGDDDVADPRVAPTRTAENTDAKDLLGTGVVGDAQPRLLLNHLVSLTRCGLPDFRPDKRGQKLLLLGLLKDLHEPPALGGRQRAGLHEQNAVTDTGGVLLVVRLHLGGGAQDLGVPAVLLPVLELDDD